MHILLHFAVQKFNFPIIVGFIVAILMGLIVGKGLGYPSLRLKGVYLSLTTIGFSEITRFSTDELG